MNRKLKYVLPGALLAAAIGLAGCDVEQTQEGDMPDVDVQGGQMPEYEQTQEGRLPDVDVQGGEMPEYDVEGPDVDVTTEERTVTVPEVDVTMPDDEPDMDDRVQPVQPGQEDPGRPTM